MSSYQICANCTKQNYQGCCPIMYAYMKMNGVTRDSALRFSCREFKKNKGLK